jgi:ferredoxin-NADP reductase
MGDQFKGVVQEVVSRIHPKRMKLRVSEIVQETPSTKTFRFERLDGPLPPFRAGQYVNVFVDVDGVLTSRPYSISSPPGSSTLELTVRDKPGGFVAPYLLNEVKVGDELETTGPAGHFYHEPLIDGEELVFLAGGSGITPFMSLIRDAAQRERPLKMHLLYGSRELDDVIYADELVDLASKLSSLDYALVLSDPLPEDEGDVARDPCLTGFLDAELIKEQVGDVAGKTFYICGPPVMYDFCLDALAELGVPRRRIRRELFGPPDDVTREPGWPEGIPADAVFDVEVVGHKSVRAPAVEPLMNTLERYGIIVPAECRTGTCSACRTKLISGRVYQPAHTALRESDHELGYIHACVSYPLEDLKIRF